MGDGFGPFGNEISSNDEVVVEMRNGGDVPGVASQAAGAKAEQVIHKVSDDDLDDLLGELRGGGRACRGVPLKDAPREPSRSILGFCTTSV